MVISKLSRLSGRSERICGQIQGLQLSHHFEVTVFLSGCQMDTWMGRPGSSSGHARWAFHAHANEKGTTCHLHHLLPAPLVLGLAGNKTCFPWVDEGG